jgi:hypothetical protein
VAAVTTISHGFRFRTEKTPYKLIDRKDKAIPLQALTDPEGSRRLRLPDFKTIGT